MIFLRIEGFNFNIGCFKYVCPTAFNVRMVKAAGTWALGPGSPCFAQKCYELKTFPLIYSLFFTTKD